MSQIKFKSEILQLQEREGQSSSSRIAGGKVSRYLGILVSRYLVISVYKVPKVTRYSTHLGETADGRRQQQAWLFLFLSLSLSLFFPL